MVRAALGCLAVVMAAAAHTQPPEISDAPGTVGWASARVKWKKRPVEEGTIPDVVSEGSCPDGMANVGDRFCVDRWEASLDGERAVSRPGVMPTGYVSGVQAAQACKLAGKRLCSAAEWRFACGGTKQTVHPYGTSYEENRCNDHGHSPMAWYYPGEPFTADRMNDPRLNQFEGTVAKTGTHEGCVNDYGIFDMEGNLHEWTSDPNGTFQGGYYLDTRENGEGCAYRTSAHDFDYHDYSTGFRCCADRVESE